MVVDNGEIIAAAALRFAEAVAEGNRPRAERFAEAAFSAAYLAARGIAVRLTSNETREESADA